MAHTLESRMFSFDRPDIERRTTNRLSLCYSLMYLTDTPINNGNREQTKQGMLRSPVGAIAPPGSSCVIIFKKRIIGTAM